jgi:hypothetical protein
MAEVAQLVEHQFVALVVAGSIPVFRPISYLCLCGGIGRRDRLKIYCPLGRVRSSRTRGTILKLC